MPKEEDNSSLEVVAEEKEEEGASHSEVYKFYEQHISSLSPYIVKELKEWIQKVSGETVLEALKVAFEQNMRTLAYVKGILRNWCSKYGGENSVMGSLERRRSVLSCVF